MDVLKKEIINLKEKFDALVVKIDEYIPIHILLFIINIAGFLMFLISLAVQFPVTAFIGVIIFFITLIKLI